MDNEAKDRIEKIDTTVRKIIRAFRDREYVKALGYLAGAGFLAIVALLALKDILKEPGKTILLAAVILTGFVLLLWVIGITWEELTQKPRSPNREISKGRRARRMKNISVIILLIVATTSVIVAALAGAGWVIRKMSSVAASEQALLDEWGYPQDLVSRQHQLQALKLGPSVTTVAWLTSDLTELDLTGTGVATLEHPSSILDRLWIGESRITDLSNLPSGMHQLDASWLRLPSLGQLPPQLTRLDLENVAPKGPVVLPDSVTWLRVSGDIDDWLARWPENLEHLHLIGARLQNLRTLPTSLESLELSSPVMSRLDLAALSPNLKTLTLRSVSLDDLSSLPESLTTLEISHSWVGDLCILVENNPSLPEELRSEFTEKRWNLPDNLDTLVLRDVDTNRFCGLPSALSELGFQPSDSIPSLQFGALPRSIRRLAITWPAAEPLKDLPPLITDLAIIWADIPQVGTLPRNVQRLDLSESGIVGFNEGVPMSVTHLTMKGCPAFNVSELPPNLELLDVQGCRNLTRLPDLPPKLGTLNISRTAILSLEHLPEKLGALDISNTPIQNLEDLPPYLASLTLSEGQVESLVGLPKSVRRLAFVEAVGSGGSFSAER